MIRQSSSASRPNRLANRKASPFSKRSIAHAFRVTAVEGARGCEFPSLPVGSGDNPAVPRKTISSARAASMRGTEPLLKHFPRSAQRLAQAR